METTLPGTTIYEEHQSFWVLNVILLAVAMIVIVAAVASGSALKGARPEDLGGMLIAIIAALVGLWGFSKLNTVVTTLQFRFGFPIWNRRVPVSQVQVGDVVRIPVWAGIGLHFFGGQWIYNARLGRGVQVVINGRRYLIGSENPERLQAALLQVAPRRSKV